MKPYSWSTSRSPCGSMTDVPPGCRVERPYLSSSQSVELDLPSRIHLVRIGFLEIALPGVREDEHPLSVERKVDNAIGFTLEREEAIALGLVVLVHQPRIAHRLEEGHELCDEHERPRDPAVLPQSPDEGRPGMDVFAPLGLVARGDDVGPR